MHACIWTDYAVCGGPTCTTTPRRDAARYIEPINVALSFNSLEVLANEEIVGLLGLRLARLDDVAEQLRDDNRQRYGPTR